MLSTSSKSIVSPRSPTNVRIPINVRYQSVYVDPLIPDHSVSTIFESNRQCDAHAEDPKENDPKATDENLLPSSQDDLKLAQALSRKLQSEHSNDKQQHHDDWTADNQVDPNPSAYERSWWIGLFHYAWAISNLCKLRRKKGKENIKLEDVPLLGKTEEVKHKVYELERAYAKYKAKHKRPSLVWPIARVFWKRLFTQQSIVMIYSATKVLFTLFLSKVLEGIQNSQRDMTYKWAGGLFAIIIVNVYCHHFSFFQANRLVGQLKPALIGLIYNKINRCSHFAVSRMNIGKIVNIAANELNSFEFNMYTVPFLFIAPLVLAGSLLILWTLFGVACLPGIGFILLLWPIQYGLSKLSGKYMKKKNAITDERIKLTDEMLEGIRIIKMYGWDIYFKQLIQKTRKKEERLLTKLGYAEYFGGHMMARLTPALGSFLIFITYGLMDNTLTADKVYSTIILLSLLRNSVVMFASMAFKFAIETNLTFQRIIQLLEIKEIETDESQETYPEPLSRENGIEFDDFAVYWGKESAEGNELTFEEPLLRNVTFSIEKGTLCVLVGKTGSGKSSLLKAFLQEIPKTTGTLRYSGRVAYVEQEIVIYPGTVRNNILFGLPYQKAKYNRIVEACSLLDDFKAFANGDMTEIGERGTNLSGGQKARISLARALYSDADIYLLDDPLSAVDSKVAKNLFFNAIKEILKEKTVILATHQIHFAKEAEKIVILEDGVVKAHGSLPELVRQDRKMMEMFHARKDHREHQLFFLEKRLSILNRQSENNSPQKDMGTLVSQAGETGSAPKQLKYETAEHMAPVEMMKTEEKTVEEKTIESKIIEEKTIEEKLIEAKLIEVKTDEEKKQEDDSASEQAYNDNEDGGEAGSPGSAAKIKGKLVSQEKDESSAVGWRTYLYYIKNAGNFFTILVLFINLACIEGLYVVYTRFLGYWTQGTWSPTKAMIIISGVLGGYILALISREILFVNFGMRASKVLHEKVLSRVIRAVLEFFDTNPGGRILNRFSNDLGVLDRFLLVVQNDVVDAAFYFTSIFVTIWILFPWLLLPGAALVVFFTLLVRFVKKPITQGRGIELLTRSPIYSLFSLTLSGLVSIRAFGQGNRFVHRFMNLLNRNTRAYNFYYDSNRVFGFYCDFSSALFACGGIAILISVNNDNPSVIGLACCYLLSITDYIQFALRQTLMHFMQMASTARIESYTTLPQEAPLALPADKELNQGNAWPSKGEVVFSNVFMKYRENTDHILKGLTFSVQAGEKIGCVGRTGAGKSTIIQALFRMVEIDKLAAPESSITIDGVDILKVGLHAIRKKISIIPQSPFIFKGTVRKNLDPLEEHTTDEVIEALKETNLWGQVSALPNGLDTDMSNASSVFSVGQKQLVCLARTLLQKNKILVLDEATANVDFDTDNFIQEKIMEKFKDVTIFTIAHRLSTVAHYDKVLVMDKGQVREFDHPYRLLVKNIGDTVITNKKGVFASMVRETGAKHVNVIFQIARTSYFNRMAQAQSK